MRKLVHKIPRWSVQHLGVVLAFSVFIVQAILIPHVGMSWDEPASFFIGRANLKFWMTGNRAYVDDIKNPKLFTDSPFQYIYGEDIYPPFPFLVASSFSFVFAEHLHLTDVYTAHHLGELVIAVFGVWALYGLSVEAGLAVPVAAGVTIMYSLYPAIFELMRADPKDIPLVSLFIVAAYFCLRTINAWRKKQTKNIWINGMLFSLSFGLAECTKPTAAFLVPIIVVWLVAAVVRSREFRKSLRPLGPFAALWFTLLGLAVFVFFFMWPWLWDNPVDKIFSVWSFFKTVGLNMPTPLLGTIYNAGINLPKEYPFVILLIQSPIELTVLMLIGMMWAIHQFIRKRMVVPFLFVVWFWMGMCRFLIPGMLIYSRVRHFIDAMPAYFILAGMGVWGMVAWVRAHLPFARVITIGILLGTLGIIIIHDLIISVRLFPYESQYFNFLVGGVKNVADNMLFDVGSTTEVKEAVEFINKDSKGAPTILYPCLMAHIARFYTAPNVQLTLAPESAAYTIVPNSFSWFEGAMLYGKYHHDPVFVIRRDNADLFYVYKYKRPYGWRCGWETISNYEY